MNNNINPRTFLKTLLLQTIFTIAIINNVLSQDPSFSQVNNLMPYYHSSYLGINSGVEIKLAHRNQWKNVDNGFKTYLLNASFRPKNITSSFGLTLLQDQEGAGYLTTQLCNLIFRQHLNIKTKLVENINIGGYAGISRKFIDFSKLIFSDQIDPVYGIYQPTSQQNPISEDVLFIDCGISTTILSTINISSYRIPTEVSVSLNHIFSERDESIQQINTSLPTIFILTISGTMQKSTLYNVPLFVPVIQYELQKSIHRIKAGSLIGVLGDKNGNNFFLGVNYSFHINSQYSNNASSIVPIIGYEKSYNNTLLTIGYSYDVSIKGINTSDTGGSHEISFTMSIDKKSKRFKQPSNIFKKCPE